MDDEYFKFKVKQHLNASLYDMPPEVIQRLSSARRMALTKQKKSLLMFSYAGLMHVFSSAYHNNLFRNVCLILICTVGIAFYVELHVSEQIDSIGELDSELLSSELPLGAYTDDGFAVWLNTSSQLKD